MKKNASEYDKALFMIARLCFPDLFDLMFLPATALLLVDARLDAIQALIRTNDFRMLLNLLLFWCASKSASSFLSSATNGNSAGYWEENYDVIQNKMTEEDKIHRKMILHPVILLLQHVLL